MPLRVRVSQSSDLARGDETHFLASDAGQLDIFSDVSLQQSRADGRRENS
ncbi:MAG: hypothetical protein ACRDYA_19755 [Egibacteraceae bacterium]